MAARRKETEQGLSVHQVLRKKILQVFRSLPENQRKVANYILHRPSELAFHTADSLSRKLSVSKATVVRFAQSVGFDGFTPLQNEVLEALRADLMASGYTIGPAEERIRNSTLRAVAETEIENINETIRRFEKKAFNDAVSVLLQARRVYTAGVGISSILAQLFAYQLRLVAVDAHPISADHMRFIELLSLAGKKDVFVGFSFQPYSRETVDAASFARDRGCGVIAVTDSLTAPISFHASRTLTVRTKNLLYTNSVSAVSMVMNALVTEIAIKKKHEITSSQRDVARALEETGQYIRHA